MDAATRQISKLSIDKKTPSSARARRPKHGRLQLTERDKADAREFSRRLSQKYMLEHEPWRGPSLSAEYTRGPHSSPPILFFGIGFKLTVEDLLPVSQSLGAAVFHDENHPDYLYGLFTGIWFALSDKLENKLDWPLLSRQVMSSQADHVLALEDNNLRLLMAGTSPDDPDRWDSINWRPLEGMARMLRELTGRTCKWYIGSDVWNPEWETCAYNARWVKLLRRTGG
ncbi:hypothetical protein CONPUDRAFT_168094 [Coniophora puteana RWD-64-598 SS2]|uniref:Uncharacterized protein n=1 Tax=Coniophora puteana (strain RWD-64-598) TaxID=741705 RepID=A0A5M3MCU1_CONPW|nr:uncharacterized protein CONPUDRAFT_168094 [Coniophora puteana RWD-64-598 SS2]EIW77072.1 hypothetical protein CONPUDRAFT_168094 [Coniophora puteana RWD-64-598 SS2]